MTTLLSSCSLISFTRQGNKKDAKNLISSSPRLTRSRLNMSGVHAIDWSRHHSLSSQYLMEMLHERHHDHSIILPTTKDMASSPSRDGTSRASPPMRTPTRRRAGVVSLTVPPQLAHPPRSPLPDIPRPSSTESIDDEDSTAESWLDGPRTAPAIRTTMPASLLSATTRATFRNVPENCGGTYSSDMAGPASRRIGTTDLQGSIGIYFSLGVRRCFCARVTAVVLPLSGPPEHIAEGVMATKIRHEVAARLDEEAQRSRWPEANAHMRETALFVCSEAGGKDWERSTLYAVVQGVQDW